MLKVKKVYFWRRKYARLASRPGRGRGSGVAYANSLPHNSTYVHTGLGNALKSLCISMFRASAFKTVAFTLCYARF